MNIGDKERCDVLLKLADFRMTRVASRRDHEWKVTLALWALLGFGIAHPPKIDWQINWPPPAIFLVLIVAGHACLWIYPHWERSKEDINRSFLYTDEVEDLLGIKRDDRNTSKEPLTLCVFLKDKKCLAQILTTALLAIFVWLASNGYIK